MLPLEPYYPMKYLMLVLVVVALSGYGNIRASLGVAIIVGVMEIVVILRERDSYARIWPVLLSGTLYVIFGVALLFAPIIGALTMVIFGGVLAILFGIALIGFAWRLYQRSKGAPAATTT